jgi:hypothetical protein
MARKNQAEYLGNLMEEAPDSIIPRLAHDVKGELAGLLLSAQMIGKALVNLRAMLEDDQLYRVSSKMQDQIISITAMLDAAVDYNELHHPTMGQSQPMQEITTTTS